MQLRGSILKISICGVWTIWDTCAMSGLITIFTLIGALCLSLQFFRVKFSTVVMMNMKVVVE